jgi:hypothetical protein
MRILTISVLRALAAIYNEFSLFYKVTAFGLAPLLSNFSVIYK